MNSILLKLFFGALTLLIGGVVIIIGVNTPAEAEASLPTIFINPAPTPPPILAPFNR